MTIATRSYARVPTEGGLTFQKARYSEGLLYVASLTAIHSIAQSPCTGGRPWPPRHSYP